MIKNDVEVNRYEKNRANKVVRWTEVLATKLANMRSIPETHMAEGKRRLLEAARWPPQSPPLQQIKLQKLKKKLTSL